jgi:predicted TIM-barrel fold metal-dependent hydrolase
LDDDGFELWRAAIRRIAPMPNVVVKISALGQWGRSWTLESARRWVSTCIYAFGPKRTIFGSNFPVDGLFSSYGDLVGAYRSLIAEYTPSEQQDMLSRNSEQIFRI